MSRQRGRTPPLRRTPRPEEHLDLIHDLRVPGGGARRVVPVRDEDRAEPVDKNEDGDETPDVLEMMEGNER